MKFLAWLELLRRWGVPFLGFLLVALTARFAENRGDPAWKRGVQAFIIYGVTVSLLVCIAGREAWPISDWRLFVSPPTLPTSQLTIIGVDRKGTQHSIDRRVWEPLDAATLDGWFVRSCSGMSLNARNIAGRYLLDMANKGRVRALAGERPGTDSRWFGSLTVPPLVTYAHLWSTAAATPSEPFVQLRFFKDTWQPADRQLNANSFTRQLIFEYP